MEAQRYPDDFDGILAGAPAYDRPAESFADCAQATQGSRQHITPEKFAVLHQAALDACDALDGVKDGIISDPHVQLRPHGDHVQGRGRRGLPDAAQVDAAETILCASR